MYQVSSKDGRLERKAGRIRTVLQSEAAECGLAALAMVTSAFGQEWGLVELRRRFSMSTRGTTLRSLMAMADTLGFSARPVRLEIRELSELKLPAILHWGMNHFVVLERLRRGNALIHDPARGRRWVDASEIGNQFTGVALELSPATLPSLQPSRESVKLADIARNATGLLSSTVQLVTLALVMQVFALLMPIVNQLVVDEAITKGDQDLVTVLAIGASLLLIATLAVQVVQGMLSLYLSSQLSFQLDTNLLRHVLRLPVSWFEKRHVGDIMSRFGSLVAIRDTLSTAVTSITLGVVVTLTSATMMFIYSPMLGMLQLGGVILVALIRGLSFPYLRRKSEEGLHLSAKVETTFLETIRGARSFKLFNREQERVAVWQNEQARVVNNQILMGRFGQLGSAGAGLATGAQQIATWFFGARMVIRGEMTLGMLFAFQAYSGQFVSSSLALVAQAYKMRVLKMHLERISDVALSDAEAGIDLPVSPGQILKGALQLQNVSFRYADHEPLILQDVHLSVRPGEFVALQGPSGQGKTTILKLLLGFHDPDKGEVLVDGVPLRRYGIRAYREQIGVVLQDDQLLAGTVMDNISFFDIDLDQDGVKKAAAQACILDDIEKMPMGFATLVGDLGSTLSAGQRQRLLLARALYRQPKILFLDEGTANLDRESERSIMAAINNLNITRFVIAHREGALLGADRVFHMSRQGLVEES